MSRHEFSQKVKREAVKRAAGRCEAIGEVYGLAPRPPCAPRHSQERLGISNGRLARMSGVSPRCITRYRHPTQKGGKAPPLTHARQLAHALGFKFPDKLEKE